MNGACLAVFGHADENGRQRQIKHGCVYAQVFFIREQKRQSIKDTAMAR
jgi:hypothetical protein